MTLPRHAVRSLADLAAALQADDESRALLVIGARSTKDGPVPVEAAGLGDLVGDVAARLVSVGFAGGRDELVRLPAGAGSPALAVIGLGPEETDAALRYAAGSAVRQLAGTASVALAFRLDTPESIEAALEGAVLGSYAFRDYRTGGKEPVGEVTVYADGVDDVTAVRVEAIATAVALVKDLVNTPANDLYPETLADAAAEAVGDLPVEVTEWDADALADGGFGGILGVGMGSERPPRLVRLDYAPTDARGHLALVGKGITFDSGGLSLKPAAGMVGMKYDMTGAATVLGVVQAVARLGLPVRVTGWMCIAENMPSGSAVRPGDILTIRGGTTVEVLNTDAEGRLVLADGLAAASEEQPDAIVDVATLTGAAMVALGTRHSAVMGDEGLVAEVVAAADEVGEPTWPLPLPDDMRPSLNSDVADLQNANIGNTAGGALFAGLFLREFVGTRDGSEERIPWAHLDIAGTAKSPASPFGYTGKGATGVTVRTLVRLAERFGAR